MMKNSTAYTLSTVSEDCFTVCRYIFRIVQPEGKMHRLYNIYCTESCDETIWKVLPTDDEKI